MTRKYIRSLKTNGKKKQNKTKQKNTILQLRPKQIDEPKNYHLEVT